VIPKDSQYCKRRIKKICQQKLEAEMLKRSSLTWMCISDSLAMCSEICENPTISSKSVVLKAARE